MALVNVIADMNDRALPVLNQVRGRDNGVICFEIMRSRVCVGGIFDWVCCLLDRYMACVALAVFVFDGNYIFSN